MDSLKFFTLIFLIFLHPCIHTHYPLSVAIELVHSFSQPAPCDEGRAELAQTARRYKEVYHTIRDAQNILLYSLYWVTNTTIYLDEFFQRTPSYSSIHLHNQSDFKPLNRAMLGFLRRPILQNKQKRFGGSWIKIINLLTTLACFANLSYNNANTFQTKLFQ